MQAIVVELHRHGHVLAHDLLGDQFDDVRLWVVAPEIDDRHVEKVGQEEGQLPLVHGAHRHEGLADPLACLVLDDQGLRDVVLADESSSDEQRAERLGVGRRAGRLRLENLRRFVAGDGNCAPAFHRQGRSVVVDIAPAGVLVLVLASEFQLGS